MNRKTVLITGASRGIGKAIALKYASENYNIIINCVKNQELLDQTKTEIEGYGVECFAYLGDIGNNLIAREMFQLINEKFHTIDILINNAGISYIGLFSEMNIDDWNRILSTNLTSVFNCCSLTIPGMVNSKKGKIVNISSVWGLVGSSCEVAYSATKGGMNSLTKALAKELAPSNIQVNAVACGVIDTEMNSFLDQEETNQLLSEIPAGRYAKVEDVADFVYQLTEGNDYLTGQVIAFDGGWM